MLAQIDPKIAASARVHAAHLALAAAQATLPSVQKQAAATVTNAETQAAALVTAAKEQAAEILAGPQAKIDAAQAEHDAACKALADLADAG
jgi:hypothetical protein